MDYSAFLLYVPSTIVHTTSVCAYYYIKILIKIVIVGIYMLYIGSKQKNPNLT